MKLIGKENQPVDKVLWLPRSALTANNYNPNHVAPPEMKLLKQSLIEDGWTIPIVSRTDGEIVDGFHRWTLAEDPEIAEITDGEIPVVRLSEETDRAHQMMSTIRHNRARGSHGVLKMADIVSVLKSFGIEDRDIGKRLGMDTEEVKRLSDRGNMLRRGANSALEFHKGWVPKTNENEDS